MLFNKIVVLVVVIVVIVGIVVVCDNVQVVGLLIVFLYVLIVVEVFGVNIDFLIFVVELGGLLVGLKCFCEGVGENIIDVVNVLCVICEKEIVVCVENGVEDIIEVCIGYDGIVFVLQIDGLVYNVFILLDIFNVLVLKVMVDGVLVDNLYIMWLDFNVDLLVLEILVFILGIKYGICEVFEEKVIVVGCEVIGVFEVMIVVGMLEDDVEDVCLEVCIDGCLVDIDGDYIEILVLIDVNVNVIGVFGLVFYENNIDKLKVVIMLGVVFLIELIVIGEYLVLCLLFFYVKVVYIGVILGLKEYVQFFVVDELVGLDGFLVVYGLVLDLELVVIQVVVVVEEIMQ